MGVVISVQEGPSFTSRERERERVKYIYIYIYIYIYTRICMVKFIYCGTYSELCYKSLKNILLLISMSATKKLRELMLLLEFF